MTEQIKLKPLVALPFTEIRPKHSEQKLRSYGPLVETTSGFTNMGMGTWRTEIPRKELNENGLERLAEAVQASTDLPFFPFNTKSARAYPLVTSDEDSAVVLVPPDCEVAHKWQRVILRSGWKAVQLSSLNDAEMYRLNYVLRQETCCSGGGTAYHDIFRRGKQGWSLFEFNTRQRLKVRDPNFKSHASRRVCIPVVLYRMEERYRDELAFPPGVELGITHETEHLLHMCDRLRWGSLEQAARTPAFLSLAYYTTFISMISGLGGRLPEKVEQGIEDSEKRTGGMLDVNKAGEYSAYLAEMVYYLHLVNEGFYGDEYTPDFAGWSALRHDAVDRTYRMDMDRKRVEGSVGKNLFGMELAGHIIDQMGSDWERAAVFADQHLRLIRTAPYE